MFGEFAHLHGYELGDITFHISVYLSACVRTKTDARKARQLFCHQVWALTADRNEVEMAEICGGRKIRAGREKGPKPLQENFQKWLVAFVESVHNAEYSADRSISNHRLKTCPE